jgi:ATP-dependent protease HslVU (ClpYQ) peptidase subunit
MTTIAVRKTETSVVLGADKRVSPQDNMRLDGLLTKIIIHNTEDGLPVHIAVSGPLAGMQALELFLLDNEVSFDTVLDTYRTINTFRHDLVTDKHCTTDKSDDYDFAHFPMELLIVNGSGDVYAVMNAGEVLEIGEYFALGSGAHYALGALFNNLEVSEALDTAAHFDPTTGNDYDIYEIAINTDEESGDLETGLEDEPEAEAQGGPARINGFKH